MRNDKFVYLSGPMTARNGRSVEENVAIGVKYYWRCLQSGIPAFSPHLSGAFPSAWTAMSHAEWIAYDFAVIDRCTDVVMLPNWRESAGANAEHDYAVSRGIPVHYDFEEFLTREK